MAPGASSKGAIAFYAVYGACFFVSLLVVGVVGVGVMPVFFSVTSHAVGLHLAWCCSFVLSCMGCAALPATVG